MSELQEMQAVLRQLLVQVGELSATVKIMTDTWRTQEATASAGRKEVYQKLESVKEKVTSLESRVDGLSKEVAIIAPSVQAFDNARQQAAGAQKLGKIIWGLIGAGGFSVGSAITWVVANWVSVAPKLPPAH